MSAGATASSTQVNTRIDAAIKRQADEVLRLMGKTSAELVRSVMAKVARGARDYEEIAAVLQASPEVGTPDEALQGAWAAADSLFASLVKNDTIAGSDARSWDEIYSEARAGHLHEKGLDQ